MLVADRDDDDVNGVADALDAPLSVHARRDAVALPAALRGASLRVVAGSAQVRVVGAGIALAAGRAASSAAALQGLSAGVAAIEARQPGRPPVSVRVEVWAFEFADAAGSIIEAARDHLALSRLPPPRDAASDPEAFRVTITPPEAGRGVPDVTVESLSAAGARLDTLEHLRLTACEVGDCFASPPLRLVVDEADRGHDLAQGRALRAEVGGAVVIRGLGQKQMIRVLGPRHGPLAAVGRLKLTVRPFVVRIGPGGAPAIGGNDAAATAIVQSDLALASALFGQCGLSLGDTSKLTVRVVDPPTSHLLSLGDRAGLPASGGILKMRVDGKPLSVTFAKGSSIDHAARQVSDALTAAGFVVVTSVNARATSAAAASADLSVRRRDGSLATVAMQPDAPLTTDATLSAAIGTLGLSAGLDHFVDDDSPAGTLAERTLIKAFDDHDPRTIELFVVPYFAGFGRIGESFISGESPSMRNVVILDRAGVRARRTSFTAAHELGHVLLGMPGHPDDFGVDTPTQLLDSDAADASAFGPRRITLEQCERALRVSGPLSASPLLSPWPVARIAVRPDSSP